MALSKSECGLVPEPSGVNLETLVLMENKLSRMSEAIRTIRAPDQYSSRREFAAYELLFNTVVELCEDYWFLLRVDSDLFCKQTARLFEKEDVRAVQKSFTLQMIAVSVTGFLISNQDYRFQHKFLSSLLRQVHESWVACMACFVSRAAAAAASSEQVGSGVWVKACQQLTSSQK